MPTCKLTYMSETLGERIRRVRNELKMLASALAEAAGISASAIYQIETGDSKSLRPENLFPIAKKLNRNPLWLATGQGEEMIDQESEAILTAMQDVPKYERQKIVKAVLALLDKKVSNS